MEKLSTKWSEPNSPISSSPLPKSFFLKNTLQVAQSLLGKGLLISRPQTLLVRLEEVEAYLGDTDPASHAFRGETRRNWPMFEVGGTCYVYLSYGINYCMNVSTLEKGIGQAILLRTASPIVGLEIMKKNRRIKETGDRAVLNLLSGPGKLTQALGVDLTFNGQTYDQRDFKLIDLGMDPKDVEVGRSPRIGISQAKEELYRFYIKGSPWLSRKSRQE